MADNDRHPIPISIGAYTFDPLTERPDIPSDMRADDLPAETAYSLVQLTASPTRADRERLQSTFGLRLDAYVPELAYVEQVSPRNRSALQQDPAVRALVSYHPAFKISPLIGSFTFRTEEGRAREGIYLRAVLFPSGDAEAVAREIERLGAKNVRPIDDRPIHGQARVEFVAADRAIVSDIARIGDVRWIEEIPEVKDDNGNTAGTMQSGTPGTTPIWNQGIRGEGQIVGVIDRFALDMAHCFFMDNTNNTPNPAHRKVVGLRNDRDDGTAFHSCFVAGIVAGDDVNNPGGDPNRGNAFNARLTFGNRFDLSLFGGDFSLLNYLTQAMNDGAFIHTNSWHEDTLGYTQESADVDALIWFNEDNFVCGSSGNSTPGETIGPPGTAKNAVCVSAAQLDPNELNAGDGNSGPTDDGRRKPDLFAPGCNITSSDVDTGCGTIQSGCATSWATPATAAAAALVRQYFREGWYPTGTKEAHHAFTPSGALIKATLLNSTLDMNIAGYPGDQEGWGLIRLNNVLTFQGGPRNTRVWDTRNADGLVTGEQRFHHVDVASNAQPLKVTLVWSEPPAAAGANSSPINDLDVTVVSPDGSQVFTGNVFNNGFSATGGTPDTINNVEQVWINQPAPGDWTIIVGATNVNVGNPGQGYALTATADLVEPPLTVGQQDTLVVRVLFSDIAFEPSQANLINMMNDVATYIDEVSYGQATISPLFRGPIQLDHPRDYYFHPERNPLIELTEEVAAKLLAAEPGIFNRGTPNPADDIDRMVIVINDPSFTGDWATTGPWPYDLPGGFTQPISVSIQSYQNPVARFTHGLLHHFGLVDLYAHPGVVFPKAYVDEWDNMSNLFTNVHPLVWEKERAGWITAHGSQITYIPRPPTGGSYTGQNPIPLFFQESTSQNRKAIAIGLTQGAATLAQEQAFYFVEARSNGLGGFDDGLPGTGVLIYYVNELIKQGQGPVILQDRAPGTASLGDAFFQIGDSRTIPGTGITITVQAGTGGADFNIQLAYVPPVTDYNLSITKGDTIDGEFIPWFSPDIWIDSPRNGFDLGAGPPPFDQKDNPVIGEVNRIYARVHNAGPGTAFDFDVRFRVSEPYHTIGDIADFDENVGIKHVGQLNGGADTNIFVEWTPSADGDPHSCVLVDLINLVGTDTNPNDHEAQENLEEVTSVTQSPFHAVDYRFDLTNPFPDPSLFYFKTEGLPPGWTSTITPYKIRLDPGQRMEGVATIQPPKDAEVCDSRLIRVTSWSPQGDTIVPVGGGGVIVNLRKPTLLTLDVEMGRCDREELQRLRKQLKKEGKEIDPKKLERKCGTITAQGCTNPPQPNQEIIVKFIDPQGKPVYMTVTTDANGCFEAQLVTVTDGTWEVVAEYPGDKCQAGVVVTDTACHCR